MLVGAPTASERLRARWDAQVRWGIVAAVVIHAAAFAFSPTWTAGSLDLVAAGFGPTELISLDPLGGAPPVVGDFQPATPALPVPVSDAEDGEASPRGSGSDAAAAGHGGDGSAGGPGLSDVWSAYGERVRRRGRLTADLATVASRPRSDGDADDGLPVPEEEEADPDIEVDEAVPDLALPEPDSLRLERLAAVRPELALMTTSAWVLLRNQTEVEAYLRRSYTEGRLDRGAEGSVSVTLWIDREGSVEWAEVSESSGNSELDEFALAVFNEVADFRAARERGEYVSRSVTFLLHFPW